ncbi:ATP-dependent DNA ligase [Nitrobacteraceae bacterium AZCC 1564]
MAAARKTPRKLEAMEARSVDEIPKGSEWQYEPKWDGFRCLIERKNDSITMTSKSGQDLTRYFPEVVDAARAIEEASFILDGEIVVPLGRTLSFDALLQRIHPASSRVRRLAAETPALFLTFDLLRQDSEDLSEQPLTKRRPALEALFKRAIRSGKTFRLSPMSTRLSDARRWLTSAGGGSDGVIAKRADMPYQAGNREGMQKIKRYRTADCVIGGFRYAERKQAGKAVVGSVLLGLYDDEGQLHHIGFSSAIKADERPALTKKLEAIETDRSFTGNTPGGPSRWSTKRSAQWQPVKPKFVVEVSYDHFTGGRFRHGTAIQRWRPDKKPSQCTMEQLKQKSVSLAKLLRGAPERGK